MLQDAMNARLVNISDQRGNDLMKWLKYNEPCQKNTVNMILSGLPQRMWRPAWWGMARCWHLLLRLHLKAAE